MSGIPTKRIVERSELSKGFKSNHVTQMIDIDIGSGLTFGDLNELKLNIDPSASNALSVNEKGQLTLPIDPTTNNMLVKKSSGLYVYLPDKIPRGNIFNPNNPQMNITSNNGGIILSPRVSNLNGVAAGKYRSDRNLLEMKNDGLFVKGEYDTGWRRLFKGVELHSGWHKDYDMVLYRRIGQMVWMWIRRSTGNSKIDPLEARFSQTLPYGLHPNGNFLIQTFEFKNGMSFPPNSGFYRIGWDGNIDWKAPAQIRGADMLSNMVPYITNHNPVNPPPGEEVNLQAL